MKLINNKVYFAVQDYLMILLGTLLYGFGFNAFILSNEIITCLLYTSDAADD